MKHAFCLHGQILLEIRKLSTSIAGSNLTKRYRTLYYHHPRPTRVSNFDSSFLSIPAMAKPTTRGRRSPSISGSSSRSRSRSKSRSRSYSGSDSKSSSRSRSVSRSRSASPSSSRSRSSFSSSPSRGGRSRSRSPPKRRRSFLFA